MDSEIRGKLLEIINTTFPERNITAELASERAADIFLAEVADRAMNCESSVVARYWRAASAVEALYHDICGNHEEADEAAKEALKTKELTHERCAQLNPG